MGGLGTAHLEAHRPAALDAEGLHAGAPGKGFGRKQGATQLLEAVTKHLVEAGPAPGKAPRAGQQLPQASLDSQGARAVLVDEEGRGPGEEVLGGLRL